MDKVILAITGASGIVHGQCLARFLEARRIPAWLIVSDHGREVARDELGLSLEDVPVRDLAHRLIGKRSRYLTPLDFHDMRAPVSSGSVRTRGMAVVPCSMGTAAAIAHGNSRNLIERAADVTLKEKRRLVLAPRETPLSSIHLSNLLTLSLAGAAVVPPLPGFYGRPRTVDELVEFSVGKVLDALGIRHDLYKKWSL